MTAVRDNARRTLTLAFATTLFILGMLSGTDRSFAASYSFKSCDVSTHDASSFGDDWETGGLGYFTPPKNDCPNGIRFDMEKSVLKDTKGAAWFRPSSTSIIKSVKFKYYGGDTSGEYEYTVRSCVDGCDAVAQLVPGGTSVSPKSVLFAMPQVELPDTQSPGPLSVSIQIECVQAFCSDPPVLVAKNFEFEYDDSVSPSVENLLTDPENAVGPADPSWISGKDFGLGYRVVDSGSGVGDSSLALDSNFAERVDGISCNGFRGARTCDEHFDFATRVDIRELEDGEHSLTLSASDYAHSPDFRETFPLLVDNTKPAEPTGLDFSDAVTQWGWTPTSGLTISHDDAETDPRNTEFSGFKRATYDIRSTANAAASASESVLDPASSAFLTIPHQGMWDVGIQYEDGAGNVGNRAHSLVGFDSTAPQPADPTPLGWISLDQLHAGIDQEWTAPPLDPALESGICAYAFAVDDEQLSIPDPTPDVLAPKTSALIPSGIGEGHHFAHIRSIACNGKPSEQEPSAVNVDGSAPAPTLYGLTSEGWLRTPPTVSLSAVDSLSGVAGLEFGFVGPGALDLAPGSSTPITIPQGAHTITYRAIDNVGNVSPLFERSIKADWTPPSAAFQPRDAAHPNVIAAEIDDAHSGLAAVGMQIRRTDAGASSIDSNWKNLGDFETLGDGGINQKRIKRTIPDDSLADGTYEVRVTARDVAGNWLESTPSLQLTLPIRVKPALSAAIALVGKRSKIQWSGASQDRVVLFGRSAALVGSLLDAARNPIANARIAVTSTPRYGLPEPPQQITTDSRGEFVLRLKDGPTRRFDIHFDGNDRFQAIDQTADIRVRAALEFHGPKSVRSLKGFKLSGKLLSGSMGLPEGGKTVIIQFLLKNKWAPGIGAPTVDSKGRFTAPWDGIEAKRPTTVYFRVLAKHEGTWPFLSGSSKPIAVRIKP